MNQKKNLKERQEKGITLIALVITIVVLLILAGITIAYVFGDNSVFNKASDAKEKTAIAKAREKLELVLSNVTIDKHTESKYNQNKYLDKLILKGIKDATIVENVVIIDGCAFEIDRSAPKIIYNLGKIELEDSIKITWTVTSSIDFQKATVNVVVEYEGEITEIAFNGEKIILPTKEDGKYTFTTSSEQCPIEITENGSYGIVAKDKDRKCNVANVKVTEITEDVDIHNIEEMKLFRDKVNSGATYEGKTIKLINDIDLNEGNYTIKEDGTVTFASNAEQWIPIGTDDTQFSGIFDGNGNTIKGMYIYNNNKSRNGLFDTINEKGIVKNVILDTLTISNTKYETNGIYIGAVAAKNNGTIEKCQIKSKSNIFGQQEYRTHNVYIGGIAGLNTNIIKECINNAKIGANQNTNNCKVLIGGIAGENKGVVHDCYNTGYLYSNKSGGACIGGIMGENSGEAIYNCYNIGTIYCSGANYYYYIASIVGANENLEAKLENIYFIDTMEYSYNYAYGEGGKNPYSTGKSSDTTMKSEEFVKNLGTAFTRDTTNINNGYPILTWQFNN